ncbi:MAG: hypothetical protein PHQ32_04490 [Firmicutes bacterium]|nr:hypothetical protein [Bacillota bacterium]
MKNKNLKNTLVICAVLLFISFSIYYFQVSYFHDIHETMFLLFQELAFLPISVIIISYILEKYMKSKEKEENFQKLQIIVSAFYSEIGTSLIRKISKFDKNLFEFKEIFKFENELKKKDKKNILNMLKNFNYNIDSYDGDLADLKEFLTSKKTYIARMFENPNLLEHSRFTDMLWAVYHVLDELENRDDLLNLPKNDMNHLSIDLKRAYVQLINEWFEYMTYLNMEYPYLFSLAIRKSPFEDNEIIIQ